MTPEEIITDAEIERVHGSANFGPMTPRRVVDEGVLKTAFGYDHGSTATAILREHGLIRATLRPELTSKGYKYLRAMAGGIRLNTLLDAMGR